MAQERTCSTKTAPARCR